MYPEEIILKIWSFDSWDEISDSEYDNENHCFNEDIIIVNSFEENYYELNRELIIQDDVDNMNLDKYHQIENKSHIKKHLIKNVQSNNRWKKMGNDLIKIKCKHYSKERKPKKIKSKGRKKAHFKKLTYFDEYYDNKELPEDYKCNNCGGTFYGELCCRYSCPIVWSYSSSVFALNDTFWDKEEFYQAFEEYRKKFMDEQLNGYKDY
jgi:hypothetical protein